MSPRADPRPKSPARQRPRRRLLRRLLARPLRWLGYLLGAAALWVAAYAVINPPGGYYMATEWIRLGHIQHQWKDISEISPNLVRAAMAGEDARFCEHWGFDFRQIRKAIAEREHGRFRGASTISQQVARNVFLWQGRTWVRKGLEAGFTVLIEALWSKRRIMEVYLNVAEFGQGVFGAEAAASHFWDEPAARLSLPQAARLAAVLPDPKGRDPRSDSAFMSKRTAAIMKGARTLEAEGRDRCVLHPQAARRVGVK